VTTEVDSQLVEQLPQVAKQLIL
ncbi:hypothetical protein A2U01_0043082, partial [Trifolium medium]|nr:hypothetical protein [Trifolium medium]